MVMSYQFVRDGIACIFEEKGNKKHVLITNLTTGKMATKETNY